MKAFLPKEGKVKVDHMATSWQLMLQVIFPRHRRQNTVGVITLLFVFFPCHAWLRLDSFIDIRQLQIAHLVMCV